MSKMGKNVLENLTTGMYQDSKIIFREYIQNSADQIDKAISMKLYRNDEVPQIEIDINTNERNIRVFDNATGVKASEVEAKLVNVADSDKNRDTDKGFRGIGRLGGLAFCDVMRFITSFKGETVKTVMTWDAKLFISLINDVNVRCSAEEIIDRIVTIDQSQLCGEEEHFFIVELENIRRENNELLDVLGVSKYVSSNAPTAFNNKFIYVSKINEYIKENSFVMDEYKIHINGNDILKNYSTCLYENSQGQKKKYDEIYDVEFKQFKNSKGEMLAWMWFGISAFDKQIPESTNEMRGLRLRKSNIQIGGTDTLVPLFKEARGNFYFIGEVHAVHKDLIPIGRRDYFSENATRNELEAELEYFFSEVLHKLYHDANKVKNAFKKEAELLKKQSEFIDKKKNGFNAPQEAEQISKQLKQAENENLIAQKELKRLKDKANDNSVFNRVINVIERKHLASVKDVLPNDCSNFVIDTKPSKEVLVTDGLKKLDKKQKKLVSRIYTIISNTLTPEISENLIKKIQDELNK